MRWTVVHFREAMPGPHKREGRSGFRSPCPVHGGTDRAWVRRGRRAVVGGCNSGCSLPDLARAVGLVPERRRAPDMVSGHVVEDPRERVIANVGYPRQRTPAPDVNGPDRARLDPALLARALAWSLAQLTPRGATYLKGRGLDPQRLVQAGWRSIDGPKRWRTLDRLLPPCGWTANLDRTGNERPSWPAFIDSGAALTIPYKDASGAIVGVRFRRMEGPGPKYVSMKGDSVRLYGQEALARLPLEGVVHIAEGEIDAESLRECGALAIGIPGVMIWKQEWTEAIARARPRVVVTWFDRDPGSVAGPRATERVARALRKHVAVLPYEGHPQDGDVNDLLCAGALSRLVREVEE